jgi:hypothetical protein
VDATGISAGAYGDVNVTNNGDILAGAATLSATKRHGHLDLFLRRRLQRHQRRGRHGNRGLLRGTATGIYSYGYYSSTVTNDGDLNASSITGVATAPTRSHTTATRSSTTAARSSLFADRRQPRRGGLLKLRRALIYNSGSIDAGGGGSAAGAQAISLNDTAGVYNDGSITVTSYTADATGVAAYGKYAEVSNYRRRGCRRLHRCRRRFRRGRDRRQRGQHRLDHPSAALRSPPARLPASTLTATATSTSRTVATSA